METDEPQMEFPLEASTENHKCSVCGEESKQPLLAKNYCGPSMEEYYACSRCLSKVAEVEKKPDSASDEPEPEEEQKESKFPKPIKIEVRTSCQHELGHLKKRDRGSPIPDECLICAKMIECM